MTKIFRPPTLDEMLEKQEEFFSKSYMMSYSGLSKLLFSPKLFYLHYILGQKDDNVDKSLIEGRLIHCLFLNPEDFDKEFVLMVSDIPGDNPREVLHRLYAHYEELKAEGDIREDLNTFNGAILDILQDMNLYQAFVDDKKTPFKTGDEKRLDKILTEQHEQYWEYLKNRKGKTIIDREIYDFAVSVVEQLKENTLIMHHMGFTTEHLMHKVKVNNEVYVAMFDDAYQFGIRGILDNLVIDDTNKVIKVNDLKKTSKDLNSFKDSIVFYKYWLQAGIYYMLVKNVYLNRPEYKDYKFEFRFIVVDAYMQIAPIRISDVTLEEWVEKTKKHLDEANYHFKERNFDLPYEFLINKELVL